MSLGFLLFSISVVLGGGCILVFISFLEKKKILHPKIKSVFEFIVGAVSIVVALGLICYVLNLFFQNAFVR